MVQSSTETDDPTAHHPHLSHIEATLKTAAADAYRNGFLQKMKAALARQHARCCGD